MTRKSIANLLLIEDNPGDARLFREMFDEQGAHSTIMTHVETMSEAEQFLAGNSVDIILLDLGLPDAQGLDAVRRTRKAAPQVPLVVLTGHDDELLAAQSLQEGVQDYLIKGQLETRGLVRALRYSVERKFMEVELETAHGVALESVRLKTEFLANMSHEIRTPMNGVIGMTSLLLGTDLSARQQEYAMTIQSCGEALLKIIDDILDFSKIETGLMRFETIDFELRHVVEAPVELLASRAQAKGLELTSLVHSDVPTALRGDPGRLRQILTNLIGNAIKFTERGEIVVSVTKLSETPMDVLLRFAIKDTGIGVCPQSQTVLFQPFTQADGSTTRKYGGTGLGLAISKELVELMGGQIGIESAPDQGSTFWFTGNFGKQSEPSISQAEICAACLDGVRALVVDDNQTSRSMLVEQMSTFGMVVDECDSPEKSLDLLRLAHAAEQPYAIAVFDSNLPEIDGFELADIIKADEAIASVALLLLPSVARQGDGETSRKAGIAAYLQKPVHPPQLFDCLTTVIARQRSGGPSGRMPLITKHSLRESGLETNYVKPMSDIRILVAEDNLVNQKVALGLISNLGYEAKAVANGLELLEAIDAECVDIILMDCQMPAMDGFDATNEIRRREGADRHTMIIAMTANALESDREKCLAHGMDDYLSKPVKPELLRQKLSRWIDTVRSERSRAEIKGRQQESGGKIDQTQMNSLREIQMPNFIPELIDLYLDEATADISALRKAIKSDEQVDIKRIAHHLMGSSANIGATQMAAFSAALFGKDSVKSERNLQSLEREFELVRAALEVERARN